MHAQLEPARRTPASPPGFDHAYARRAQCSASIPHPHQGDLAVAPKGSSDRLSRRYAESFFGHDFAHRLMRSAELCDASGRPLPTITQVDFWMLCLASINEANDENHGCTTHVMPKSSWSMVYSAMNQMDTIGAGLRRLAELTSVIPCGLTISLGYSANNVTVNYGVAAESTTDYERAERYAELMALVIHCVLLWCANRPLRAARVRLSDCLADKDGSMATLLSPHRTRVGTGTTVTYHRDDMTHPLGMRRYKAWASHETSMFLEMVEQWPLNDSAAPADGTTVVGRLRQILAQDNLSQQDVARRMGMSVATLQRRLADTGHSFREVSRDVREEKLRSLLATDSSLDDIAVEIGFSERRSLWRACHDWLGMSPAHYRRTIRASQLGM